MSGPLILVADGAYPHPPYDFLPADIAVWAGYAGGHTAHAWTRSEVADLEATGRQWWGIWTAVQGRAITMSDAVTDALGAQAVYAQLGYPTDRPALYDVEYSTWAANPAVTTASAEHWCDLMRSAGWAAAAWYGPCQSTAGWRACWGITQPGQLPAGTVGIQFANALHNDAYDLSVFRADLRGNTVSATGPEHWDAPDWAAFRREMSYVINALADGSNSVYSNDTPVKELEAEVAHLPVGTGTAVSYTGTVELHPGT